MMKRTVIGCSFLLIALWVKSQPVEFIQAQNWSTVKQIAARENKFIFLDVFATWCVPCKMMDKNVYPQPSVGAFINKHFIAVKLQMDTSVADSDEIKGLYDDAHRIGEEYNVAAYPTYLFFSPRGEIVHRQSGYLQSDAFLGVASAALNPDSQVYTQIRRYQEGVLNYANMPALATHAKETGNDSLSNKIAADYINNYLAVAQPADQYKEKNLRFLCDYLPIASPVILQLFYGKEAKVDSVVQQEGLAQLAIIEAITRTMVNPLLWPGGKAVSREPDWQKLQDTIQIVYGENYAERVVLTMRMRWYRETEHWTKYIDALIAEKERDGLDTTEMGRAFLNNMVYDVFFQHARGKQLDKAIEWMQVVIKANPSDATYLDTYANLLYKKGKVKKAIRYQQKASALAPGDKAISDALHKMKAGQPTWDN